MTEDDNVCILEEAECIFDTITCHLDEDLVDDRVIHTWREINGDHDLFIGDDAGEDDFVSKLIGTIENKAERLLFALTSSIISLVTYTLI